MCRRLGYLLAHALRAQTQCKDPVQGGSSCLSSGAKNPGESSEDVPDIESILESGEGMLEMMLGKDSSGSYGENLVPPVTAPANATTLRAPVVTSDAQTTEPHTHVSAERSTGDQPAAVDTIAKANGEKPVKVKTVKSKKHRLKQLMYPNRRRRRSDRAVSSSSSSEGDSSGDSSPESEGDGERGAGSGRFPRSSSEESLPVLLDEGLGEDDLDMLEELSDSSSGSDGEEPLRGTEREGGGGGRLDSSGSGLLGSLSPQNRPNPLEQLSGGDTTAPNTSETVDIVGNSPANATTSTVAVTASAHSPRHRYSSSKRQIVLAANFNLAPSSANPTATAEATTAHGTSPKVEPKKLPTPVQHEASTTSQSVTTDTKPPPLTARPKLLQ